MTIDNIAFKSILCEREKLDLVKKQLFFSSCLSFKQKERKPKNWFEGHSIKPLFYLWLISSFEVDFISILNCWQYLGLGLVYFLPLGIYSSCLKERFIDTYF